jgi:outer membrane protein, heavy metal efflux system
MKLRIIVILLLFPQGQLMAQTIESILQDVSRNNQMIEANTQYWNVRRLEYRTGLTPPDPTVEFDYMYGSPAGAGNQRDFSAVQRFEFPTAYAKRRQLSNVQVEQADWQAATYRQDILLQAKQTMVRLIYYYKRQAELNRRLDATSKLVGNYQRKLEKGDGTILEVNKARLQLLAVENDYHVNETELNQQAIRLIELNGGQQLQFYDTSYPVYPSVPSFELLDSVIEANDPLVKVYEYDREISEKKLGLQRSLSLPKPEVGYHSQGILGQSYKGFHVGTSIPLWENRNRLKAEKANVTYNSYRVAAHRTEHRAENRRLYEAYQGRKKAMEEYQELMSGMNNTTLLDKALRLGQITTIEYFLELSYYYNAYDKYLEMEHEYQQALAALYKYIL